MSESKGRDIILKRWYLPAGVLWLAFALRVYHLGSQSIWWDEGHSIQMASAPLAQISTLPGMDVHPPGYFAALHQWMAIAGRSEFALRYLSAVFGVLTVALLMRFGRSLGRQSLRRGWLPGASQPGPGFWTSLLAGCLAAVSPFYVAYAQEVRMYALVTFFALASVYFEWSILKRWGCKEVVGGGIEKSVGQPVRKGWLMGSWVGYVLATAASLYTHYFTIFLLVFENLAWLVWVALPWAQLGPRRRRMVVWLGTQVAVLLLFAPQLPLATRQAVAYANPNLAPPSLGQFVSRSWLAYTLGSAVEPGAGRWLSIALALVLGLVVLAQLVAAWRAGSRDEWGTLAFLVGWLLVPLAAYLIVLQRRPSFEPRYMMLATPALLLMLARGLAGKDPSPRGWRAAAALMVAAIFGVGTWSYFANAQSYKDDSAGVAEWLAAETGPGDVVYVDVPHPFDYYAERIHAPVRYLFVDVHTAAEALNAEAAGHERFFWVTWRGSDTDPRGVIPFLLDKVASRAGELDFRGYHVTWWDLADNVRFSLPANLPRRDATFGDVVRLDGAAFSESARVGTAAWATLHFTLLRETDTDYRVSARLRGPQGEMLPPSDKDLLNDRHFRTSAWPLGDARLNQAINVYTLPIPPDTLPGSYCLEVVVYDAASLEPLPVAGATTSECGLEPESGSAARLGAVTVSP